MMLSDTIWARSNVLMYHHYLPSVFSSKLPTVVIERCYKFYDKQFKNLGNNIYNGIKNWESIILGILVEEYGPYPGGKDYLDPVISKMTNEGYGFVKDQYDYIENLKISP